MRLLDIGQLLLFISLSTAFISKLSRTNRRAFTRTEPEVEQLSLAISDTKSSKTDDLKKRLLELIPKRPFGAPATNITTDDTTIAKIEEAVAALEVAAPLPPLLNSTRAVETLDGDWQLIYSNASEITRIAKLSFGFRLGPVFQPINATAGRFENQALIKHVLRVASGHTRVLARFWLAPLGEINRAGVINDGNRANVEFQKVIFTLRRFLIIPTFGKIRKTALPRGPSQREGVTPSIDVTYLDDEVRISRGGDGSLFVLVRADGRDGRKRAMPALQLDASEISVADSAPTYDASKDILPSGRSDKD